MIIKRQPLNVVIYVLLGIISYLSIIKITWCRWGEGRCGSCGLGAGACPNGSCVGFLPIIPGRWQMYSKCRSHPKTENTIRQEEVDEKWCLNYYPTAQDLKNWTPKNQEQRDEVEQQFALLQQARSSLHCREAIQNFEDAHGVLKRLMDDDAKSGVAYGAASGVAPQKASYLDPDQLYNYESGAHSIVSVDLSASSPSLEFTNF
tara:strand:+ start:160 stop:771 length:612 start_codon:yes stop_codon:yes gene_type:complete